MADEGRNINRNIGGLDLAKELRDIQRRATAIPTTTVVTRMRESSRRVS